MHALPADDAAGVELRDDAEVLDARDDPRALLAVDLGLRTGLALYGGDGRLRWYRSQHFGNPASLRRAAHALLASLQAGGAIVAVVIEGGGALATAWEREGARLGVNVRRVSAETWRLELLLSREQRTGTSAKQHAGDLARRVIAWSGAARPTSLRHDAAEAILVGLWAVLDLGWLDALPDAVRRR
jgi:hypothetical protein